MKTYHTISEAVNDLIQKGYTIDFTTQADKDCPVYCRTSIKLPSDDFQVDEIHRFEDNTSPGNEMIVFAISSHEQGVKGIAVNVYNTYTQRISTSEMEDISLL